MPRPSLLWPSAALLASAGGFLAVRALAPVRPAVVSAEWRPTTSALDSALRSAQLETDPILRRLHFLDLLDKAAPADLQRLLQSPLTSPRGQRAVAQRWAETDAAGFFDFLKSISPTVWDHDSDQNKSLRDILFTTWTLQDADAALAAAASQRRRPQFRGASWVVVEALFSIDPVRAFAAVASLPPGESQAPLRAAFWQKDPAAFLQAASTAPLAGVGRLESQLIAAFSQFTRQDPAAAATWLKSLPVDKQTRLWIDMPYHLAQSSPATAQAWFNDLPTSPQKEFAGAQIVRALAESDPRAALDWLQDNLQGGRTEAFSHVARALAEKDVGEARQLLDAMPPGAQRDVVVEGFASAWFKKETKPAMAWLLSLPVDDPGRARAIESLSFQWAQNDLPAAASYVREAGDRSESQNLLSPVTQKFSQSDLPGGLAWAVTLDPERQQSAAMRFFSGALEQNKIPQLFTGLGSLPAAQQTTLIGGITTSLLESRFPDSDWDTRALASLKALPPELRPAARTAVQQSEKGTPARKQTVLDALK